MSKQRLLDYAIDRHYFNLYVLYILMKFLALSENPDNKDKITKSIIDQDLKDRKYCILFRFYLLPKLILF